MPAVYGLTLVLTVVEGAACFPYVYVGFKEAAAGQKEGRHELRDLLRKKNVDIQSADRD
jgi:hypothetical protein